MAFVVEREPNQSIADRDLVRYDISLPMCLFALSIDITRLQDVMPLINNSGLPSWRAGADDLVTYIEAQRLVAGTSRLLVMPERLRRLLRKERDMGRGAHGGRRRQRKRKGAVNIRSFQPGRYCTRNKA